MTNQLDTTAIRAQMEALAGFTAGPWNADFGETYRIKADGMNIATANFVTLLDRIPTDHVGQNVRLIAAAPDIHATILALCAEVDRLNAAIVRQAGAAKTLRESTLAEVQYLKDQDRSEYHAAASLDSERLANEILTDESDKLRAENELLRTALTKINVGDGWAAQIARAALAQEGGE